MLLSEILLLLYESATFSLYIFCIFPLALFCLIDLSHIQDEAWTDQSPYVCQLFIDICSGQHLQGKKFLFTPFCRLIAKPEIRWLHNTTTSASACKLCNTSVMYFSQLLHLSYQQRFFRSFYAAYRAQRDAAIALRTGLKRHTTACTCTKQLNAHDSSQSLHDSFSSTEKRESSGQKLWEKQFRDQQLKSLSMQDARQLPQLSQVQSVAAVGEK